MGKYMRKSKAAGDVVVMELAVAQSSLGVRTRAKTLALKRMKQLGDVGGASYLQLRNRKLEKLPLSGVEVETKRRSVGQVGKVRNPNPNLKNRVESRLRVSSKLVEGDESEEKDVEKTEGGDEIERTESCEGKDGDGKIEAFVAENSPEFDAMDRSSRESTPCSYIRGTDTMRTPGSTTRPSGSVDISKRMHNSAPRIMPTAKETEAFFAEAEQKQHINFIEKYNFDPAEEKPLPGRYDWIKTDL